MNTFEVKKRIKTLPYFSRANIGDNLYERFRKLHEAVKSREEGDIHQLNKGNVSGLWFMKGLTDEAPVMLVRSSLEISSYERLLLHYEIGMFAEQDIIYDYNLNVISGDTILQGLQKELTEEIMEGRVFTVYDKEREG